MAAALTAAANEGEASFTRNLLAGTSDADDGETATLSISSVQYSVDGGAASATAPAGVSLSGTTLTVDPSNPAFTPLAAGVTQTIVVSYNVTDAQGATVAQTETITITGTDNGPVISGQTSGSVSEDTGIMVSSGQLSANTGTPSWSIVGGTTSASTQDFRFAADDLTITRNGNLFFQDTFGDGSPPPSAPNLNGGASTNYTVQGTFTEANWVCVLRRTQSTTFGATNYGERAMLNSEIRPSRRSGCGWRSAL